MNPQLLVYAIKSIMRLKLAGQQALEQSARDQSALFPDLVSATVTRKQLVAAYFSAPVNQPYIASTEYQAMWTSIATDNNSVDSLYILLVQIKARQGIDFNRQYFQTETAAGSLLVGQWSKSAEPVSPLARFILAAADVALEYVTANPAILHLDGTSQQLVGAFAGNLKELIPDDGNFGPRTDFAQRLCTTFLRAGLQTASDNPQWVTSQAHLQALITATSKPLIAAFPSSLAQQLDFHDVMDALSGPVATKLLQTVADNQQAFLGQDLSTSNALGAVTNAVLLAAAQNGLANEFSKEGLLNVYQSVLGVAVKQPALFIGNTDTPSDKLVQSIFTGVTQLLQKNPPPFNDALGVQLATTALTAVAGNAGNFVQGQAAWQQVAIDMAGTFAGQLSTALQANGNLKNAVTQQQMLDLARVAITAVAAAPSMVVKSNEALQAVIGAVATAMSKDSRLLLGSDEWHQIVKVAAQEAAANPGRLFNLDMQNPNQTLAAQLLGLMMDSAGNSIDMNGPGKTVLYGTTLSKAIKIVLQATSGNSGYLAQNMGKLETLLNNLNTFVAANPGLAGSKEWLRLFRVMLQQLLQGQDPPQLTPQTALSLLHGGV